MKFQLILLASGALFLSAADFWTTKPFTDWSDKDLQKIMTDSPWAKKSSVLSLNGPSAPGVGGSSPGGRGGRGGGGGGDDSSAPNPISERPGGGVGGGPGVDMPSAQVVVSWSTALPVKQAIAKAKYGKEVGTSPEAKAFLEREEQFYVVEVSQLPFRGRSTDELREAMVKSAVLAVKGKDSVRATDVQVNPRGKTLDLYFMFPRQRVFTLEDSEVEFSVKAGEVPVKQRFKLKDMVFDGKLAL
jgi:hypothetical protein